MFFREFRADFEVKIDYPSGELWATHPREIQIGKYNRWSRESVFKWNCDLQRIMSIDPAALSSRLDELMN